MASLALSDRDRRLLDGERGPAGALAMRILMAMAEVQGATRLLDITRAHIDGCLYHGQAGLDFAERLAEGGAAVTVPTTLNVASLDLLHPERYRGDAETGAKARRLMDLYVGMGCRPTWTCAPYQLPDRPAFGEHIAWAESNAIVFANSVLGARTDRYGDFIDICAALTGRAPDAGLHRTPNRRGEVVFRLLDVPERLLGEDVLYPVLGHLVGAGAATRVPVIDGLPATVSEDQLKAVGAAAASSGAVGLFHVVGVTPEAPTLEEALQGSAPSQVIEVTPAALASARDSLSTVGDGGLTAVSVGTPHLSLAGFERLAPMVDGLRAHPEVPVYVSTGRDVLPQAEARGWVAPLRAFGATLVADTCTYITPILAPGHHVVMTDSAKWAYYAPGNIGVEVVFGSTLECLRSAARGSVWRDPDLWTVP